jgi:hypothetical protein
VVAHAVFRTPDDGCKEHPKHVEKSYSEIKYRLLGVASVWKLIYIKSFQSFIAKRACTLSIYIRLLTAPSRFVTITSS